MLKYMGMCLDTFSIYLKKADKADKNYVTAQLLSGEMERRLGRFDDSRKRFNSIKGEKEFKDEIFQTIIGYQLELIGKKDTEPHTIPEKNPDKLK